MKSATDWSPDGAFLLFRSVEAKTGNDLLALRLKDRKVFPVVQTAADEREGQFSPDGKWVAFVSNDFGRQEVYVQPFPGPGPRRSISSNGGAQPRWSYDWKELFYIALDGRLMAVHISSNSAAWEFSADAPVPLFATNIGGASQMNFRQQYSDAGRELIGYCVRMRGRLRSRFIFLLNRR